VLSHIAVPYESQDGSLRFTRAYDHTTHGTRIVAVGADCYIVASFGPNARPQLEHWVRGEWCYSLETITAVPGPSTARNLAAQMSRAARCHSMPVSTPNRH
jgi:hypothetical protein